ncbi:MAG: glycerophosphoryl diester phosphodiesterase [Rhodospirillales bacterium]|jgi:glycerophosphoryl diester phosphodiesterase
MKIQTPFVIGHRGAAGHAPENTAVAFKKAAELGARWVEFDVRLTRDSQPIVFHDETLERTTNGRGRISDLDWDDIQEFDAGQWYGSDYLDERILTLQEAIAVLQSLGLGANVEIKSTPGREVESGHAIAAELKKHWPSQLPSPLISSFQRDCILAAKQEMPDVERALIVGAVPGDWEEDLKQLACEGLHCRHDQISEALAKKIIERGFSLRCYTVNENKRAQILYAWGIHAVFTDYPDRIKHN